MEKSTANSGADNEFSPEKRLEAPNHRLIRARVATISEMERLRECVSYENAHQNRTHILRRLQWKVEELRENEKSRSVLVNIWS